MVITFCPECLDNRDFNRINKIETFAIRDESISIKAEYLQCNECMEKITDPKDADHNLDLVYREYRVRKGFFQPEEVVKIRKSLKLSISELEKRLGWTHRTLERYETGALQTLEHNEQLKALVQSNEEENGHD